MSIFLFFVFGCKDPIDADTVKISEDANVNAPTDLNGLTSYLFQEWDNENQDVLAAGVENIEILGAEYPTDSSNFSERSFEGVTAMSSDDVSDVELMHGYNPEDAGGVAIFLQSQYTIDDHVSIFLLEDQTPVEPASPYYIRTITDGSDCFSSQDCDVMTSENDIERKNILVDTEHQTQKVWRWVTLDDGRRAISGRTWQPALADTDKDDIIYQNYSVEVWIPNDSGTLRFLTTWSQNSFEFSDALILGSVNDALEACDDYLAE